MFRDKVSKLPYCARCLFSCSNPSSSRTRKECCATHCNPLWDEQSSIPCHFLVKSCATPSYSKKMTGLYRVVGRLQCRTCDNACIASQYWDQRQRDCSCFLLGKGAFQAFFMIQCRGRSMSLWNIITVKSDVLIVFCLCNRNAFSSADKQWLCGASIQWERASYQSQHVVMWTMASCLKMFFAEWHSISDHFQSSRVFDICQASPMCRLACCSTD